jgi:hypothetical protein
MLFMKTSPWCINQISFLVAMIMIVSIKIKLKMGGWYVNLLIYYGKFLSRKKKNQSKGQVCCCLFTFLTSQFKVFHDTTAKIQGEITVP